MVESNKNQGADDENHHHLEIEHETTADLKEEQVLLARAIGGWRGVIDSGLPAAVFVICYVVTSSNLTVSLAAAISVAFAITIIRLLRRQPIQQVLMGLIGVGVSAFIAAKTGQGKGFFLKDIFINAAYGAAMLVSILIRWPLVGVIVGVLTGRGMSWRAETPLVRRFAAATWIWVGMFALRLVFQIPLYTMQVSDGGEAAQTAALGIVKIVLGWPLFLATAYVTYLVLKPTFEAKRRPESSDGLTVKDLRRGDETSE